MLNYDNAGQLKDFLHNLKLAPQKRFGQNFLINSGAKAKIINALNLEEGDEVWEIGPGLGAMTSLILKENTISLKVFEIDRAFISILNNFFNDNNNFSLVEGDVLKTMPLLVNKDKSIKILGNLPYNISIAVVQLFSLINFSRAIITVQKEMAERMMAKVSTKNYSSFSVFCQTSFTMKNLGILKAGSFYPKPNVESMIVELEPLIAIDKNTRDLLDKTAKSAFSSRRKTLKNNFYNAMSGSLKELNMNYDIFSQLMKKVDIDESRRAEEIEPSKYLELVKQIKKNYSL